MMDIAILFKSREKVSSGEKGFTLVELIVGIVALSFALFSLVKLYSDLVVVSVDDQYRNTQTLLAQEMIEEVRSRRFDELLFKGTDGLWSATIGVDSGESITNRGTFDDIDDYNGWTENPVPGYPGFSRAVTVCYIFGATLDACPMVSHPPGDVKLVIVTVSHNAVQPLTIRTLVSSAKSRVDSY